MLAVAALCSQDVARAKSSLSLGGWGGACTPTCIVLGVFAITSLAVLRPVATLCRPVGLVMEQSLGSREQELWRHSPGTPGQCEEPARLGQEM